MNNQLTPMQVPQTDEEAIAKLREIMPNDPIAQESITGLYLVYRGMGQSIKDAILSTLEEARKSLVLNK